MKISRRHLLMGVAASALRATTTAGVNRVWQRRYRASATITLLSIPVLSRGNVGSGFTVIEESDRGLAIRFGAGSWPESARGLNRLGFIEEALVESRPGQLAECSYFAFMTTSAEKNAEQAMKALQTSGPTVPYVAAEATGRKGAFTSTVSRVELPSHITWRDYPAITDRVRAAIASASDAKRVEKTLPFGVAAPATFCMPCGGRS